MNMVMRATAALLAVLSLSPAFGACGGGAILGGAEVERDYALRRVSIQWGDLVADGNGAGGWGYAENVGGGSWRVTIDRTVTIPSHRAYVLAHELGHAADLGHLDDPMCLMNGVELLLRGQPCVAEAAYLAAWGASHYIEIVDCPLDLQQSVVNAINLWSTPSAFKSFNGSQGE